jgi:hypothetical protein
MKELHPSQVYSVVIDYLAAKAVVFGLGGTALLLSVLASASPLKYKPKFAGESCAIAILGTVAKNYERSKKQQIGDIGEASRYGFKQVVSSLVQVASTVTINQSLDGWNPDNLIDLNELASMLQKKHGRIIGGTGTGKSVLAKALVKLFTAEVKIYDVEATKLDWQGFEVVGRGENYYAIAKAMTADLKLFADRIQAATSDDNDYGWNIFKGKTHIRIVEEYPDCKDEVNSVCKAITEKGDYDGLADEWCQRIARRGRKPEIMQILLSQYDSVGAWGFEGKGSLVNCFHAIRLGQFAVDRAKKIGDKQLGQWLEADIESRCMVDNLPCQLPTRTEMILMGSGINSPAITLPLTNAQLPIPNTELNELETYILDWGKRNPNQILKARTLQQVSKLFKQLSPEDIRIVLASMADKGLGEVLGEGDKLGWKYPH